MEGNIFEEKGQIHYLRVTYEKLYFVRAMIGENQNAENISRSLSKYKNESDWARSALWHSI